MKLANEAAIHSKVPSIMTKQALEFYKHLANNSNGDKDFSFVYQLYSQKDDKFKL